MKKGPLLAVQRHVKGKKTTTGTMPGNLGRVNVGLSGNNKGITHSLSLSSISSSTNPGDFTIDFGKDYKANTIYTRSSSPSLMNYGSEDETECFDQLHHCLPFETDPFIGLVKEQALEGQCCSGRAFTLNENPDDLTVFGKRFQKWLKFKQQLDYDGFRSHVFQEILYGKSKAVDQYLESWHFNDSDKVKWMFTECSVCCNFRLVRQPPCCRNSICYQCWQTYVENQSQSLAVALTGSYKLTCFGCTKMVPYGQASSSLERDKIELIRPPGMATRKGAHCPNCLKFPPTVTAKKAKVNLSKLQRKKGGQPIDCDQCSLRFCTVCGFPDHPDKSCKQLMSDETMEKWARQNDETEERLVNIFFLKFIQNKTSSLIFRMPDAVPNVAFGCLFVEAVPI